MSDDGQVHGASEHDWARAVLDFWFGLTREQWFAKDEATDRVIGERFGTLREEVVRSGAEGWREHSGELLAAIILVDQFSRNLFRGRAEAFAHDALAQELTLLAIANGWEARYGADERAFLYLPLEHAEDMPLQRLSVERYVALGDADYLTYARDHAAVIERFGRFPSRNAALGRESTPEERDWLAAGGGW